MLEEKEVGRSLCVFPIISFLRRAAASYVYIRPEGLKAEGGKYWLRLDRGTSYADLDTGRWGPNLKQVPMYELVGQGGSEEDAAIALAKKENDLAEKLRAKDLLYTLVLGPELTEITEEGLHLRRSRLTVIRGIFRASGREELETVKATSREKVTHRRLPPGVIHERR